ncbi:MAG: hypothetical protein CM15mV25_0200 [uncultured marine virus]|nr:MAG: hypothetical protein CM15mV25_0200 [uncultured marine virus]
MASSQCVYTADTTLDNTYGESLQISGTISVANSSNSITGFGTRFNTELRIVTQLHLLQTQVLQ